jgi:proline dehydrogenase
MSITRSILLRASRSSWLAEQSRQRAFARRAVRRFLPGEEMSAALAAAADLRAAGIGTVLTSLGEQVRSREEAAAVREHYLELLGAVHARGLPAQISVKLTHLGLDLDAEACLESLRALIARAEEVGSMVWIDMEEAAYVDTTLALYRRARQDHERVGVCLQAYLRRTPADLESLLPLAPAIRLVKGAYRETPEIAFPKKRDTDAASLQLAERLLDHSPAGTFPVLGTHDLRLIRGVQERAEGRGLAAGAYEVHMLYGIRPALQRELASGGVRLRVLVSYGENWFPWYMRRIAERPANMWFVVRNLIPRGRRGSRP